MLRGITRVPVSCQSMRLTLDSVQSAGLPGRCCALQDQARCCVWDLALGRSLSPCRSDAMESGKQERALPLLAALPALGLDGGDKRP